MAIYTIDGIKIKYHDNSTDMGVIQEIFFEDPYKIIDIFNNSIIIDIGAHIGTFSIRCANEKNCTVYAYEPCSDNYELLIDNIYTNKLNNKIKAFNKAVSNKNTIRDFCIDPYHYSGSSFYLKVNRPYYIEKVECITLRQIFDDNKIIHCDVLKLDCELEEKHILINKDNDDILKKVDQIILEHHCMEDGKEIAKYLESKGFIIHSNNQFLAEGGILHAIRK